MRAEEEEDGGEIKSLDERKKIVLQPIKVLLPVGSDPATLRRAVKSQTGNDSFTRNLVHSLQSFAPPLHSAAASLCRGNGLRRSDRTLMEELYFSF